MTQKDGLSYAAAGVDVAAYVSMLERGVRVVELFNQRPQLLLDRHSFTLRRHAARCRCGRNRRCPGLQKYIREALLPLGRRMQEKIRACKKRTDIRERHMPQASDVRYLVQLSKP